MQTVTIANGKTSITTLMMLEFQDAPNTCVPSRQFTHAPRDVSKCPSVLSVVMLTLLLITILHAFGVHGSIKIINLKHLVN